MKKFALLCLCIASQVHASRKDQPIAILPAHTSYLTIQETFTALGRILTHLSCLTLAPDQEYALTHAAALMHSCMQAAQSTIESAQIQPDAPLSELIMHLNQNGSCVRNPLKTNPIDELEAAYTQKPCKPQRKDDDDRLTETALSSFLNCCGHFAAITSDPKNSNVVRPHVLAMVGNILNVAREACRRGTPCNLQAHELQTQFTDIVLEAAFAIRVQRTQRRQI